MNAIPFVIAGDNHGDEQNDTVIEKFFDWMDDFQPSIVIHGGDNWNFSCLRKGASEADKAIAIAPDYEAGADFAKRMFSYGKHRFFVRGNHDERIYNTARDCTDARTAHCAKGLVSDVETLMRKHKVKMLQYDSRIGVFDFEGIRSIHGYAAGVGAARKFASVYGTCAFNHTHSGDVGVFERWPEPSVAYGVAALLNIDQSYNAPQIGKLRHQNGWLYGYTDGKRATYIHARYQGGSIDATQSIKRY